jgi:hypothetical protein
MEPVRSIGLLHLKHSGTDVTMSPHHTSDSQPSAADVRIGDQASYKPTSGETVEFHLFGKCVNGPEQSATDAKHRKTRAANGGGGTRSAGAMQHHAVPNVYREAFNSSQNPE